MNTGVGDQLTWAGSWPAHWPAGAVRACSRPGGRAPALGLRAIEASGGAMAGRLSWRAARPDVREDTAGAVNLAEMAVCSMWSSAR